MSEQVYNLTVRGKLAAVGTFDHCCEVMMKRWGWVPINVAEEVLKAKIEPLVRKARR